MKYHITNIIIADNSQQEQNRIITLLSEHSLPTLPLETKKKKGL